MLKSKIIVSLTSYPARIPYVRRTVETLLRQTVPPDMIILTLVREEFSDADPSLMEILDGIEGAGVLLNWQERNLRPHNKYFWTIQSYPDDIVITVDDDILYPLTLIQSLLECHYRHPRSVIANRTHLITKQDGGELAPYAQWILEQDEEHDLPCFDLIATGVGGVLYPPHVFDEEVFDADGIEATCLLADDLWLLVHEARLGIPVVNTTASPGLCYVPGSQDEGLYIENLENGRNDAILAALFERYPEEKETLYSAARDSVKTDESDGGLKRESILRRVLARLR